MESMIPEPVFPGRGTSMIEQVYADSIVPARKRDAAGTFVAAAPTPAAAIGPPPVSKNVQSIGDLYSASEDAFFLYQSGAEAMKYAQPAPTQTRDAGPIGHPVEDEVTNTTLVIYHLWLHNWYERDQDRVEDRTWIALDDAYDSLDAWYDHILEQFEIEAIVPDRRTYCLMVQEMIFRGLIDMYPLRNAEGLVISWKEENAQALHITLQTNERMRGAGLPYIPKPLRELHRQIMALKWVLPCKDVSAAE